MASWTDTSADWLQEQIKAHPDLDKKQLRAWCGKNYPFAHKTGWAYKAWLKAMRAYFNPQAVKPIRKGKSEPSTEELEKHGKQRLIE